MKKLIILSILILILITQLIIPVSANYTDAIDIDANICYVISADADSTVIYNKNGNQRFDPAGFAKIVTAILVIENCDDLDMVLTGSSSNITITDQIDFRRAGILVGEQVSVKDLLYCLLVYDCSESANILAEYFGGAIDKFVIKMNSFVEEMGLENTHFSTPGGYEPAGQYTTAEDMAVIYNYCIKNPMFMQISSTFRYEMAPTNKYKETRYLINRNYLLNSGIPDYYYKYVKCGKDGVTPDNRYNSISFASKDGYNYICVVMDSDYKDFDEDGANEIMAFVSSKKLLDWVFENIRLREVVNTTTYVGEVSVELSDSSDFVALVPKENISVLVPAGVNSESVYIEIIKESTFDSVDAPVKKGDILGKAAIKYAGNVIAEVDLVAAFDVELSTSKLIISKIKSLIFSPLFIVISIIISLFVVSCFVISYRNKQKLKIKRLRAIHQNNEKKG